MTAKVDNSVTNATFHLAVEQFLVVLLLRNREGIQSTTDTDTDTEIKKNGVLFCFLKLYF